MRFITKTLSFLLLAATLVQCQKEISHAGTPDNPQQTPSPVTANVQGTILDENGQPAAGAIVRAGSKSATTDAKGYFRINGASLDKNSSFVTVEKAGYFKGYRSFAASSLTNHVEIKLIPKALAGTITAAAGGAATLANGAKVELPAGGIVMASNGAAYSGDVKVYAAYIDPTAADMPAVVPGSLMADTKDGKRVVLASYGMIAVELESATGDKLQIKTGSSATLTTPIPASILSSAPASIALWSIDETTGIWKEEGTATKNGNSYIGTVKHFSFWNCDISVNSVRLSMTVKSADSLPLRHVPVRISFQSTSGYNFVSYGWTDSMGMVNGFVPGNAVLNIRIVDQCGNTVYQQNAGPYTQNTNLGVIYLPATNTQVVTVKGKLVTCAGTPVLHGFALIQTGHIIRHAATDNNGDFSVTFLRCGSSTATLVGLDVQAQQQSTAANITLTSPVTNTGTTQVCGTSSAQFINYTVDGVSYILSSTVPGDSIAAYTYPLQGTTLYRTSIMGFSMSTSTIKQISFNFNSPSETPGSYPVNSLLVNQQQNSIPVQPFNIVMTQFPTTVGQFYEGSFSGSYRDSTATGTVTRNINGSFKLRK